MYLFARGIPAIRGRKETGIKRRQVVAIWIVRIFLFSVLLAIIYGSVIDSRDRKTCREAYAASGYETCEEFAIRNKNESCLRIQCDF